MAGISRCYIDTPNIADDLTEDDALKIIEKVCKATVESDNGNNNAEKQNGEKHNTTIFIVVSVAVLLTSIFIIGILLKKRNK